MHPFVIQNVKPFTVSNHLVLLVASTNDINIPVLKLVVRRKGCPCLGDGLEVLNFVGQKMVLKHIVDRHIWRITVIHVSRDDDYSVVGHVNGPSVLQRLVQLVGLLVVPVAGHYKVPLRV